MTRYVFVEKNEWFGEDSGYMPLEYIKFPELREGDQEPAVGSVVLDRNGLPWVRSELGSWFYGGWYVSWEQLTKVEFESVTLIYDGSIQS
jgi:hypothetical protein